MDPQTDAVPTNSLNDDAPSVPESKPSLPDENKGATSRLVVPKEESPSSGAGDQKPPEFPKPKKKSGMKVGLIISALIIFISLPVAVYYISQQQKSVTEQPKKAEEVTPTPTPLAHSGGTVSSSGIYRIHTFTTGGTFVANFSGNIEVLVVAGGGSGGVCGGGGGGGVVYHSSYGVTGGSSIPVTVGAGGTFLNNGENSVFGSIIALGGGAGPEGYDGAAGGSGGGGGCNTKITTNGGSATQTDSGGGTGYGNAGAGNGGYMTGDYPGGGGGGAGVPGGAATHPYISGNGGDGKAFDISGTEKYYGGGGSGAGWQGGNHGVAGKGGGGTGSTRGNDLVYIAGTAGEANTGGGGGAMSDYLHQLPDPDTGYPGGSGIVIVRYVYPQIVSTSTPTATPGPIDIRCDASCESDSQCPSETSCVQLQQGIKRCRKSACPDESNCSCPVTPTLTPVPEKPYVVVVTRAPEKIVVTATPTKTPTPTPIQSGSTATMTPTKTPTPTMMPTNTPSPTLLPMVTATPTLSPTPTPQLPVSGIGFPVMGMTITVGAVLLILLGLAL